MQKNHNEPEMPSSVFVALVGRPNVGKSSLTNHLVGEKSCHRDPKGTNDPQPYYRHYHQGAGTVCAAGYPPASISRATGWIPA